MEDKKKFYKLGEPTDPERNDNNPPFDPAAALLKYRIDLQAEIMEPPVLIEINKAPIATLGNFSLLIGKAKGRKTFYVSAQTAAAASGYCSIEGIRGTVRTDANKILYFDTEQAPFHAQRTVKRICKQIGTDQPENLEAFGLRSLEPEERWKIIDHAITTTPGLALVVIDGIVDLLSHGINDEVEATKLTTALLRWTQEYNIHIITVLHQNKADFNARGHIGTYLVNKAESVLSVTKDQKNKDISIVKAEYCKDKDFADFAFTINEEGLSVLADTPPPETNKQVSMRKIFEVLLPPPKSMKHNKLKFDYMERAKVSDGTAKSHIKLAVDYEILVKDEATKSYKLSQSEQKVEELENYKLFHLHPQYEDAPF